MEDFVQYPKLQCKAQCFLHVGGFNAYVRRGANLFLKGVEPEDFVGGVYDA
jgi:hypothetical protein